MPFVLTQMTIGSAEEIEVSSEDYLQIRCACDNILQVIYLEEKFDILLGNYVELETDLLAAAARDMVYQDYDALTKRMERNFTINRRFLNMLAACRAYVDQGAHDLKDIKDSSRSAFHEVFSKYTNEWYDRSLGYRVMDALRGYTQHRGYPIRTTYDRSQVDLPKCKSIAFSVLPKIDLEHLRADKKVKQKALAGIKPTDKHIEAMPLARKYVEALCSIHMQIRGDLSSVIGRSESIIMESIERFTTKFGESSQVALAVIEVKEGLIIGEPTYLLQANIDYRKLLTKKNNHLNGIAGRFVSGKKLPNRY